MKQWIDELKRCCINENWETWIARKKIRENKGERVKLNQRKKPK
jgi:hypothetical protein